MIGLSEHCVHTFLKETVKHKWVSTQHEVFLIKFYFLWLLLSSSSQRDIQPLVIRWLVVVIPHKGTLGKSHVIEHVRGDVAPRGGMVW